MAQVQHSRCRQKLRLKATLLVLMKAGTQLQAMIQQNKRTRYGLEKLGLWHLKLEKALPVKALDKNGAKSAL